MSILGQCGKCGHRVLHVNIEEIVGVVDGDSKARILTFSCIHCHAVLGVQLDPRTKRRTRGKHEAASTAG